jgi:tRNA G10  N-methylase Trm11
MQEDVGALSLLKLVEECCLKGCVIREDIGMENRDIPYNRFHRLSDLEVDLCEIKRTADLAKIVVRSGVLDSVNWDDREALSHAIYLIQTIGDRAIEHFADLCDHIGCGSEFRDNARALTLD